MDASELDGRKRVALALVGLQGRDRDWLLGQLPAAEREAVLALLAELAGMRVAQGGSGRSAAQRGGLALAAALEARVNGAAPRSSPDAGAGSAHSADGLDRPRTDPRDPLNPLDSLDTHPPRDPLDDTPAALVQRALADEPDAVLARVLALRDWRWADDLQRRLGPQRTAALRRERAALPALPPALAQALRAAVQARIAAARTEHDFAAEMRDAAGPAAALETAATAKRWMPWRRKAR